MFPQQQHQASIQKYCYADIPGSCDTYGGLYQWHTAMAFPAQCDNNNGFSPCAVTTPNHQGICPTNWHVANDAEWHTLESFLAAPGYGTEANCTTNRSNEGCYGADAALAAIGAGNFNGSYGGVRLSNGTFSQNLYGSGADYHWWSSTASDLSLSWVRTRCYPGYVCRRQETKNYGESVRCIHD